MIHLGQAEVHQQRRCACELRAIVMAVNVSVVRDPPCCPRSSPSQAATESLARRVDATSSSLIIDIQDFLIANSVM